MIGVRRDDVVDLLEHVVPRGGDRSRNAHSRAQTIESDESMQRLRLARMDAFGGARRAELEGRET